MPRPPIRRIVDYVPAVTFFKPAGVPRPNLEEIELSLDELEAIRLKDLEGLEQEEAAARMGVARTTFRRVLVAARAKVAEALVQGKAIRIGGGPFVRREEAFRCRECGHLFAVSDEARPGGRGPGWGRGRGGGLGKMGAGWSEVRRCRHCGSRRIEPAGARELGGAAAGEDLVKGDGDRQDG
ncbi:MAG TPA: DUF134 domain-containing protein [Firmicutes bacterium]|nr:DUF134 domain-containing protein [Bacillota bacterium]